MKDLRAGVIGHPIGHSLSPIIFQKIASELGVSLKYEKRDVNPQELPSACLEMRNSWMGWNVTLPFKEKILKHMDRWTDEVLKLQAINVVEVKGDILIGHNTDVVGFSKSLADFDFNASSRTVLVLGAGGAARAVGFVLGKEKAASVAFINRTGDRAQKLIQDLSDEFSNTRFMAADFKAEEIQIPAIDCFVNCTPVGMSGYDSQSSEKLPLEKYLKQRSRGSVAIDLVYRPLNTPFLNFCMDHGMRVQGGLEMLVWQALATWQIWFGTLTAQKSLKSELLKTLEQNLRVSE